jgi:hypothetical protein
MNLVLLERSFNKDSRTVLKFENDFTAFEKPAVEHRSDSANFCGYVCTLNGEQLALVFVCSWEVSDTMEAHTRSVSDVQA